MIEERWTSYEHFQRMLGSTEQMAEQSRGGSHTELLRFDAEKLRGALLAPGMDSRARERVESIAGDLARGFFVKKGRVRYFSQPILGSRNTDLRRPVVSYGFGPVGYNLMPSFEKTLGDATEAVRMIPYLGYGPPQSYFAPDFLTLLEHGARDGRQASIRGGAIVRVLDHGMDRCWSGYELLAADPYFHAHVSGAPDLRGFQDFVRKNPISPSMEEKLAEFFEEPITVGVRDTLRWLLAHSRHPSMPWPAARGAIQQCYRRFGEENFLLPEFSYFTWDTRCSAASLRDLYARNRRAAELFAGRIESKLPGRLLAGWRSSGPERVAFQLLDFHHDYPLFDVEPYTGILSTSTARLLARAAYAVFLELTGGPEPVVRNHDLRRLPAFHGDVHAWFATLGPDDREVVLDLVSELLVETEAQGGVRDAAGRAHRFERIPRTFYTFQQRADVRPDGRQVLSVRPIQELWQPENLGLLERYPELPQKLVVFFTQVYRHFEDTGFVADLRPRQSGRDIIIFGIWGYETENLLLVEHQGSSGEPSVDVLFVDNRDQFKQYRRSEDRRQPLGLAKHALRLVHPIVEPAFQRSIGLFVHEVRKADAGYAADTSAARPENVFEAAERGLDFTRKVVKDTLDGTLTGARAALDDLLDDAYAGAKAVVRSADKAVSKLRPPSARR